MSGSRSSGGDAKSRAVGGLVLAVFGSGWLLGGLSLFGHRHPALAGQALAAAAATVATLAALIVVGVQVAKRAAPFSTPWSRATRHAFLLVNALQYAGLLIGLVVLPLAHREELLAPMAIGVVGLHFLPLASVFRTPAHILTGGLLLFVAAAAALTRTPLLDAWPILTCGAILTLSALVAFHDAARTIAAAATRMSVQQQATEAVV